MLVALLIAALYLLRIRQKKGGWTPRFLRKRSPPGCPSQGERPPERSGLCMAMPLGCPVSSSSKKEVQGWQGCVWGTSPGWNVGGSPPVTVPSCLPQASSLQGTTVEVGGRELPGWQEGPREELASQEPLANLPSSHLSRLHAQPLGRRLEGVGMPPPPTCKVTGRISGCLQVEGSESTRPTGLMEC